MFSKRYKVNTIATQLATGLNEQSKLLKTKKERIQFEKDCEKIASVLSSMTGNYTVFSALNFIEMCGVQIYKNGSLKKYYR